MEQYDTPPNKTPMFMQGYGKQDWLTLWGSLDEKSALSCLLLLVPSPTDKRTSAATCPKRGGKIFHSWLSYNESMRITVTTGIASIFGSSTICRIVAAKTIWRIERHNCSIDSSVHSAALNDAQGSEEQLQLHTTLIAPGCPSQ